MKKNVFKNTLMFIVIGAVLIFGLTTSQAFADIIYNSLVAGVGSENTQAANLLMYAYILPGYLLQNITGTIDFGDGSQESFGPNSAMGVLPLTATHMYVDSGSYTASVSGAGDYTDFNWLPNIYYGTVTFSYSGIITITDVWPQAEAGGPYYLSAPGLLTLNGSATDPSPADAALLTYQWMLAEYPNGYNQPGVGSFVAYGPTPNINFDHAGYYAGYLWALEPGVAAFGTDFVEIYVGSPNPVPEPSTMLLLGSGLLGLWGFRKKFRK